MSSEPRVREDLVGQTGTKEVTITVLAAKEYDNGHVDVQVSDSMGEVYWTSLEDIQLD